MDEMYQSIKIDEMDDCMPTPEEQAEYYNNWLSDFCDNSIYLGESTLKDSKGVSRTFYFRVEETSFIPDLYVLCGDYIWDQELYDSKDFSKQVFSYLSSIGYKGKSFGRCELGMQGSNHICYEPNDEFKGWISKVGWIEETESELN